MNTGKNNKIYISFAIVFFVFSFIFSVNAQSTTKGNDDLTLKLQQKILLTQKQADEVKIFLNDYYKEPSAENRTAIESKIENLLDSKQKMKFDIIKKDWWASVTKEASKAK
jgi:hypothetical protein